MIERRKAVPPGTPPVAMGCITMITSGRCGVGKSAVTALLGEALAEKGKRVLIVELSNQPGCMDIFTASEAITDLADIFQGRSTPAGAVTHSSLYENLDIIFSSHDRTYFALNKMRAAIVEFSKLYDYVLVDTDCYDKTRDAISSIAMHTIVVTPPDPINIRDSKVLCDRLIENDTPDLRLLINRVTPGHITSGIVPHLDSCIDTVGIRLIGVVPENTDIAASLYRGQLLPVRSTMRLIFSNIADRLEGETVPPAITDFE